MSPVLRRFSRSLTTGVGSLLLLAGCVSTRQVGEWTVREDCLIATGSHVNQATAERFVRDQLQEMAPFQRRDEILAAAESESLLSCGLHRASHQEEWSYHANGEDTWLVVVRLGGKLIALAAIDATSGESRAITYGQWD